MKRIVFVYTTVFVVCLRPNVLVNYEWDAEFSEHLL